MKKIIKNRGIHLLVGKVACGKTRYLLSLLKTVKDEQIYISAALTDKFNLCQNNINYIRQSLLINKNDLITFVKDKKNCMIFIDDIQDISYSHNTNKSYYSNFNNMISTLYQTIKDNNISLIVTSHSNRNGKLNSELASMSYHTITLIEQSIDIKRWRLFKINNIRNRFVHNSKHFYDIFDINKMKIPNKIAKCILIMYYKFKQLIKTMNRAEYNKLNIDDKVKHKGLKYKIISMFENMVNLRRGKKHFEDKKNCIHFKDIKKA